jgi:hypothetical protein
MLNFKFQNLSLFSHIFTFLSFCKELMSHHLYVKQALINSVSSSSLATYPVKMLAELWSSCLTLFPKTFKVAHEPSREIKINSENGQITQKRNISSIVLFCFPKTFKVAHEPSREIKINSENGQITQKRNISSIVLFCLVVFLIFSLINTNTSCCSKYLQNVEALWWVFFFFF